MLLVCAPKSLCSVLRAVFQPSRPALTTGVFPAYEGRRGGCRNLWTPCLSPFADRDLHSPVGWQKCLGITSYLLPPDSGLLGSWPAAELAVPLDMPAP